MLHALSVTSVAAVACEVAVTVATGVAVVLPSGIAVAWWSVIVTVAAAPVVNVLQNSNYRATWMISFPGRIIVYSPLQ